MKTLTLKKLSTAVLAAACALGVGIAQATPKVSIKVTAPAKTSGANAAALKFYKDLPWLPCVAGESVFGGLYSSTSKDRNTIKVPEESDQLQFDLEVTNEDISTTKDGIMDFDLYVFFYNMMPSATSQVFALKEALNTGAFVDTAPTVVGPYTFANMGTLTGAGLTTGPRTDYRTKKAANFSGTSFKTTLLNGPILLNAGVLKQGMWNVLAVMVNPATITDDTAGAKALQNPQNWEAWTVKPFIVGTPFATNYGTTVGSSAGGVGDGGCY